MSDTIKRRGPGMKVSRLLRQATLAAAVAANLSACAPEIGSERWCNNLKEKPKGDWSLNEAADFAKHCIFR